MQNIRLISPRGAVSFTLEKPDGIPTTTIFESLYGQGMPTRQPNETQGMTQIGATYYSDTVMPRDMDFGCYVFGRDALNMYAVRQQLNEMAATRDNALRIEYVNDYGEWYCYGTVTSVDYSARIGMGQGHFQPIHLAIHCSDPYWRIVQDPLKTTLLYEGGMFQLPVSIEIDEGIYLGTLGYATTVNNHGTESAPMEVWLNGPAQYPWLINETTGEIIELSVNILSSQILYINTKPGSKQLTIIDKYTGQAKSAWDYFEFGDNVTLWQLAPGVNELRYRNLSDDDNQSTYIEIRWEPQLLGV